MSVRLRAHARADARADAHQRLKAARRVGEQVVIEREARGVRHHHHRGAAEVKQPELIALVDGPGRARALDLADHAYVIETGRVVLSGSSDDIRKDDAVRRSYLGY